MLYPLLQWAHILAMVGVFGAIMVIQFGFPREVKEDYKKCKPAFRFTNILLAIGFLVGLGLFFVKIKTAGAAGEEIESTTHMLIGFKLVALLIIGAFLGIGGKHLKQGRFFSAAVCRISALVALALAAFLGVLA